MSITKPSNVKIMQYVDDYGAAVPQYIIERTDLNETYVKTQLAELVEDGYLRKPATGMYVLTEEGREELN